MPEVKFNRDFVEMNCLGLDLNRPVDSVKQGKFPYMKNTRSYVAGRIEPREGITKIAQVVAGQSPVHSCRRLNDPLNNTYARIVGAGTHIAYGQSAFTDLDSGYSGDPLAMVPWKPRDSPNAFMVVADRSRMRKVTAAGGLHTVGWAAPANAPAVALTNSPKYKVVDDLNTLSWTATGTAGTPSLLGFRITTTITYILYDSGTTGWASVVPASMVGIGIGARIDFNPGGGTDETVFTQAVFSGSSSITIGQILYDSGSTGLCSIALTSPVSQAYCDALIRNTTRSENARIVAVTRGPDGTVSLRLSTVGTWVAGDSVQVQNSFRVYLANNHATAETLQMDGIRSAITNGTGNLTKTAALDLSQIASGVVTQPADHMHISFRLSDPTVVTELRVLLDVDSAGAGQSTTFTSNYFMKAFRTSDLTLALSGAQSLLTNRQTTLQRSIIDGQNVVITNVGPIVDPSLRDTTRARQFGVASDPASKDLYQLITYSYTDPVTGATQSKTIHYTDITFDPITGAPVSTFSQQLGAGTSVWAELVFPISDLTRIGTDSSRSLANVNSLRIVAIVTGSVNLDLSSWWIGGGYGPDTGFFTAADVTSTNPTAVPYHYRYRVREKLSNVPSNWSPAARYDANPNRQSVDVKPIQYTPAAGTSLGTTDFFIDIERIGGLVNDWHYVGTIANSASPLFTDIYNDDLVGGQPIIGQNNYQMWPILGIPVTGTTGVVAGTSVSDSGTNFNLSWAPGTRILINNLPYTIYRVISTSLLEIVENATSQGAVQWRIDQPTLLAQPLPCLWEQNGIFFACGDDSNNPGRLYYSNPGSETTQPTNFVDVTSPSEPLMNGVGYNTRSYVFSTDNFFQVISTSSFEALSQNTQLATAPVTFEAQKIPNGKGLFARWFLTREPTPVICAGGKDGIYGTTGGPFFSLTDADLHNLFPTEANIGVAINGIAAPNIVSANATKLRLEYYDEFLYFDYPDINGVQGTLALDFDLGAAVRGEAPGGWFWDIYAPPVVFHYGEEGKGVHSLLVGTTGVNLYQYTGFNDDGVAFSMEISTSSRDQDDDRVNKLYGDIMIDANVASLSCTATPFFNNNNTSGPVTAITNGVRGLVSIPLATVAGGTSWVTARNISLNLVTAISTSARPLFFAWEPRWTPEPAPIAAISWEIAPTTFGMVGFKHIGLCKVTHVSTVDLTLTFIVDGAVQSGITIANSGGVYKETIFRVPVMKGKLYKMRIASSDGATEFRLDPRDTFIEVKDWASDGAYDKLRVFSDFSMVEG